MSGLFAFTIVLLTEVSQSCSSSSDYEERVICVQTLFFELRKNETNQMLKYYFFF